MSESDTIVFICKAVAGQSQTLLDDLQQRGKYSDRYVHTTGR